MSRGARIIFGFGLFVALIASPARADLMFSFHFDQSSYDVNAGGTVPVEVFLEQTGTPGAGQVNVLGGTGAVGLTGSGVSVTFPTGSDDAQVLSTGDIQGNAAFDNFGFGPYTVVSGGTALLAQATAGSPVFGTQVATNTYDLLLGTFTFTGGTVGSHMTPITGAIPVAPDSNDNVTADLTVLKDIGDGKATITIEGSLTLGTPEPSTVGPCILAAILGLGRAWRRRARPVPAATH